MKLTAKANRLIKYQFKMSFKNGCVSWEFGLNNGIQTIEESDMLMENFNVKVPILFKHRKTKNLGMQLFQDYLGLFERLGEHEEK